MAKYAGLVGYVTHTETRPGIWENVTLERSMRGDVLRLSSRTDGDGRFASDNINDSFSMNHRISLVADPFAYENFPHLKYVSYLGSKWIVTSVQVERPRLIVTLGGVWNG